MAVMPVLPVVTVAVGVRTGRSADMTVKGDLSVRGRERETHRCERVCV